MKKVEEIIQPEEAFSKELVQKVHASLNNEEAPVGRCFGCVGEIEELVEIYIERRDKRA